MSVTKYELKKDISTPNIYKRAGERHTKEQWEAIFPNCFDGILGNPDEWFIDLSIPLDVNTTSEAEWIFVSAQFEKMCLRSISYKQGAVVCIKEFIRAGNIPNALSLLQKEADRLDALPFLGEKEYDDLMRRRDYCYMAIGLIKELSDGDKG